MSRRRLTESTLLVGMVDTVLLQTMKHTSFARSATQYVELTSRSVETSSE